jgi:hypothetical protein
VSFRVEGDGLAADDQRDVVVMVEQELPALVVDGQIGARRSEGQAYFLAKALAPRTEQGERFLVRPNVISDLDLDGEWLGSYRAVVLATVRRVRGQPGIGGELQPGGVSWRGRLAAGPVGGDR